jgi:ATP/maltotriose-dependent transcriptional regulator MalT
MPEACRYRDALGIKTLRTHLRNIYQKLHVRLRTEGVLMYFKK